MSGSIPALTFMAFQGMFFIITPALICGAFAERMKFSTMVVFMILWGTLIYCPLAHWVWGEGILYYGGEGAWAGGAIDFAGGTVVHINAGIAGLVACIMVGRRKNIGPPHNEVSAGFYSCNRGKKSLALNLKSEQGKEVLMNHHLVQYRQYDAVHLQRRNQPCAL